jgi:hypothetical protein
MYGVTLITIALVVIVVQVVGHQASELYSNISTRRGAGWAAHALEGLELLRHHVGKAFRVCLDVLGE